MIGLLVVLAAYVQVQVPVPQLPHEQPYQVALRDYWGTLTEKDFAVERQEIRALPTDSPDELYRLWLLSQHLPNITPAMLPAASFTRTAVESEPGLALPGPPSDCQALAWLARWDYPGNPYRGSQALKRRAFVLACVDLVMLDYLYEHDPQGADRADYLGGNLIWLGYTYDAVKDALPAEARAAFETGLKKLALTIDRWGPKGLMTDMDLFAAVGLQYVARSLADPEVNKLAERYARRLFTDPHYFHPAGYFVDSGCFDTSYNGISLYFGTWAALMSDWPFAREAIDKAYRLRAHLSFPDPAGGFSGPSEMASRCSADPPHDQWQFPPKTYGSGMVTDEALSIAPLPDEKKLRGAPAALAGQFNTQLAKVKSPAPQPWREGHWSRTLNYAYEFYKPGDYDRRRQLAAEKSPLLEPLYRRPGAFVRNFADTFTIVHFEKFAAAVHTGPVGGIHAEWQRPYGHGGGELCAFWTPATGAALLGRRRGIQGPVYDSFDQWRLWAVHAVSGATVEGDVITTTRIQQPEVEVQTTSTSATVRVSGTIPRYVAAEKTTVPTGLRYARQFALDEHGVTVTTTVTGAPPEHLSELYETIPVFLRETARQSPSTIEFQVGDNWTDATADPKENVGAIRVRRFTGAVLVTFREPTRVKLSPEVWTDGFQTAAQCRTILVNLLPPKPVADLNASIEYHIASNP